MGFSNRIAYMTTLIKDKMTGSRSPLVIALAITPKCNFRCNYCYGQYFQSKEPQPSLKNLLKLIDDLAKLGTRVVTFEGGEPLIRDDIGKLIDRVKANGMECGFNTNASFVPMRIKELKRADMICVSLDGPEEVNDLNRGKGSFKRTMAGLETALEAGIRTHTSSVMTKYNCKPEVVDWVVNFAKEKGIHAEFNFLFQQGRGKNNSDNLMASNKDIRKVARLIVDYKKKGAPILFSKKVYQNVADWPNYKKRLYFNEKPNFKYIPCAAGRFMMFIDVDGKVYPCVQLIGSFPALNYREVGIKKAWENCANYPCYACYFPCFNEFSSITNFDLEVISEQVISTFKGD